MTYNRIGSLIFGSLALAGMANANTEAPWGNPLLKDVPDQAIGLLSVDLSGSQKPLSTVLGMVESLGGKGVNALAAQGLAALNLPQGVTDAYSKAGDRRAVLYFAGKGSGFTQGIVLVLGLKSGSGMAAALKTGAPHEVDGISYCDFNGVEARVEGNTLLLTQAATNLPLAVKTVRGGPHISTAKLAKNSDTVETNAEIVGWMDAQVGANPGQFNLTFGSNFGFSMGLHKKGVSLSVGPFAMSGLSKSVNLAAFRPLPKHYLNTLPGGAYLITCIANPWPMIEQNKWLNTADADTKKQVNEMKPDVRGDLVLGLYPTTLTKGQPSGIDLLLELRPNEGNSLGNRLFATLKKLTKSALPAGVSAFESFNVEGADHAYRLNHTMAALARMALTSGLKDAKMNLSSLIKSKNIVFASVGKSVVLATSEPVLRKAVAALKYGKSALAFDPKYAELAHDGQKPTQFVIAIALSRIVAFGNGIFQDIMAKGGLGKAGLPEGLPIGMITGFLGHWPDPLMLRLSSTDSGVSARVFVPIDFDTLAMFGQSIPKGNR